MFAQRPLIVHTGLGGAPWSGRTTSIMRRLGERYRVWRHDDPALMEALQLHRWPGGPIHWFETVPPGRNALAKEDGPVVYDCAQAGLTAQPDAAEKALLARADLVLAANPLLLQTRSAHHGRIILARDGLEEQLISPSPGCSHSQLVLGCVQTGEARPDRAVLAAVARAFPFAQVLITHDVRWISAFDVCLLPYRDPPGRDSLRLAADPVSIPLACLAAGKPAVALEHAELVRDYSPIIEVTKNTDRFIEAVAECCLSPCEGLLALGRQRAQAASWEASAAAIESALDGLRPPQPHGQPACVRALSSDACAGESTWA